jgi:hypothetical protein
MLPEVTMLDKRVNRWQNPLWKYVVVKLRLAVYAKFSIDTAEMRNKKMLIGREKETSILKNCYSSCKSEFVAKRCLDKS